MGKQVLYSFAENGHSIHCSQHRSACTFRIASKALALASSFAKHRRYSSHCLSLNEPQLQQHVNFQELAWLRWG